MKRKQRAVIRYSQAFKQEVIRELENGHQSFDELRRRYGIRGNGTIQYWMKRMGKFDGLPRVIRVEKPNEKNRIKELESQIRALKEALADSHVEKIIAESRFEVVCEQQGWDPEEVKKKLRDKLSSRSKTRS